MNYLLAFTSTCFAIPFFILLYILGFKFLKKPYIVPLSILVIITSLISILNWSCPNTKYIQYIDRYLARFSALIFTIFGFYFINFSLHPYFLFNWFLIIIFYLFSNIFAPFSLFFTNFFHVLFHFSVTIGIFSVLQSIYLYN